MNFISKIINEVPEKAVIYFCIGLAFFLGSLPFSMAILGMRLGSFNFKNNDTEINLEGKKLTQIHSEKIQKLEEQNRTKDQYIDELVQVAKQKKVDQVLKPQIENIEQAVVEGEIRLDDVSDSQQELNNFVETAIE